MTIEYCNVQQDKMFYGAKFVYVNLQNDRQAISPQKSKKLLYKILNWRSVKIFGVDIIKWERLLSPLFCIACKAWSPHNDHVSVSYIVVPVVTPWLPIDNS